MASEELQSEFTPRRVLVADDEKHIARLVEVTFASKGHHVDVVFDGQAALDKIRENHYDLAVLDVMMPFMEGVEVLKIVRADPDLAVLRVVLMTARPEDRTAFQAYSHGADGYFRKPFQPDKLLAYLEPEMPEPEEFAQA
jgi:DNA-binding response OmpR family regulator